MLSPEIFDGVHDDFAWLECVPTPCPGFGKYKHNHASLSLTKTLPAHGLARKMCNDQKPRSLLLRMP